MAICYFCKKELPIKETPLNYVCKDCFEKIDLFFNGKKIDKEQLY